VRGSRREVRQNRARGQRQRAGFGVIVHRADALGALQAGSGGDGSPDRDKKEIEMSSLLKRGIALAGLTCAIAGAGPVALASADPAPATGLGAFASWQMPGFSLFGGTGTSCGANQGLFPGFLNLGPTGPLGPLGAHGPLGATTNLPCGAAAFNLGPGGPLGPGGALGSLYGQQH
jgi:hypothetical protein